MKNKVKHLDVLSCYRDNILGKLIRWFTKGRVNHTALVIEIWGELFIIDSQVDGTNLRPLKEWENKYKYTYVIHRHKSHDVPSFARETSKRAISKSGNTPYDIGSLFWYYPRYIFSGKWKGKKSKRAEERMYCSEFVSWVFNVNYWWKMSPEALLKYLDLSGDFYRVGKSKTY